MDITAESNIIVNMRFEGAKSVYNILFPKDSQKLTLPESAHILTGAVAMLVRSATKENCGMADYELMQEIIEHLNGEFANPASFEDAMVNKDAMPPNPKHELTIKQQEEIFKIQGDEKKDQFQKNFEIAQVMGIIDKKIKYSKNMSIYEYKNYFANNNQ